MKAFRKLDIKKATVVLAAFVALCTAYVLTIPAISVTQEAARPEAGFYTQGEQADAAAAGAASQEAAAADRAAGTPGPGTAPQAAAPAATDADAPAYPAQSFTETLKNEDDEVVLIASVEAPEGALPADSTLELESVKADEAKAAVEAAISYDDELAGKVQAAQTVAVNMTFKDAAGDKVEPGKPVTVKFTAAEVRDIAEPVLVRTLDADKALEDGKLDENGDPRQAEIVGDVAVVNQDEEDPTEGAEDTLKFETEDSGDYTIAELEPVEGGGAEESEAVFPEQSFSETVTADDGATLTVDVVAPAGALPEGAKMVVTPVIEQDVLDAAIEQAASETPIEQEKAEVVAADITFYDADGNEVEPQADVHVSMHAPAIEKQNDVAVVHVDDENNAQLVEQAEVDAKAATAEFDSANFSVYALVYTVDFSYSVNGKTYAFSLPGGGFVSLRDLVEILGVARDDANGDSTEGQAADSLANDVQVSEEAKLFVDEVEKVEFSDPALVWVGKVEANTTVGELKEANGLECEYSGELTQDEVDAINTSEIAGGDWALISLKAFDTAEMLTVTMKNGDVFTIQVTDSNFASTVDGKTFALIIANNAKTSGAALQAQAHSTSGRLSARQTGINYLGETVNEEVYFCDNEDSIKWTFEYIKGSGNQFYLKANNGKYLKIEENGVSLSDEPSIVYAQVNPGDNDHVRLCADENYDRAINLYGGSAYNGFGVYGDGGSNEWFTLCKPFNMNTNTPGTISTVDNTAEGIELKLFDYDFITTPGTTGDLDKQGNKVEGKNGNAHYNNSVNNGKKFWFLGWGADSNESTPGINDFTGLGDNIRALQGIVKNNLVDGYPELAVDQNGNATNESLDYLFDGTAADTKTYTANHLFEKIGDKYSYDSNKHYAEFNKNTGNFTVYDGTLEQNSGSDKNWVKNDKAVGFFPFDSYSDMKGLYDNNRLYLNPNISENDQKKSNGQHYRMNHHNGMSLDAHFRLPEGGQDSYGNDIEFEFSGDDDLWVYIDDVLVLDIGGVHQPLNGKINFTTGEVTVDAAVTAKGADGDKVAGTSTTIEEMFRKAGKEYDPNKLHEMKVFWIERGGCDSNCKIEFNLPLTTTKEAGAITFDKVSALNNSLKLAGAVFTLYTDAECTTPLTIGNVPVTATSGEDGVVNFYAIPTGDYYVKETTFPEGYAAKDPEEIFTVHVAKDTTSRPLINGEEVDPVTNEPKKISVDVEKVWENGIIPDGAAIEIVLGRYRLVEDPNAQGKGTLVIRDSYTGLPTGSNYNVTYTITGPDNYSNTIHKSYADTSKDIEISVPNLPAGFQYTVTKTVAGISHYNTNNGSGAQTAIVPKKGSVDVGFSQSTFTRNAYKVTIYSLDKKVNVNTWVAAKYYPANSSLYLRGSYKNDNWARGRRFQYSFDNSTFKDFQIENNGQSNQTGRTEQFTLNQDIDIYIRTQESDNDAYSWTKDYDWFVNPTINGANPVSTNSAGRMMMASPARAAANVLSQTAPAPTLPDPPKDTVYELDAEYAADPGKITLSGNTWTGSIGDLYADNEYGPYVYYIAQVNETGMPEGTQITIADEISLDGSANVLTVTNNVPTGSLEITKTIQKNGTTDTSAAGTFYYAVYSEAYDPDASPAQTPVRTGSITVSSNGTQTVTETGLYYGSYYVYELTGAGGTPIVSGSDGTHQTIGGTVYKVTGSGSSATIGASSQTASAALNNNKETVSKTATKSWSDSNPDNLTIYFKLFYEANNGVDADGHPNIEDIEVAGAGVKELVGGTTSVTWDDLPKYDGSGNEYVYLVKEYVMKDGSLVAAAPDGYVKTEDGLSVTNSRSEGYDPKTEYTGTKIWVDTANNGATRPETLRVTLYANGEPTNYTAQWTKGTGEKANEWTYTFSDLPVFDQNGSYIQYAVSEAEISGYDPDDPEVTPTAYQQLESQVPARVTTNSSLDITLDKETDLAYIAIKKNANSHLIWTQRAITAAEKQKLYEDINNTEGFIGEMNDSTVEFVSGLPIEKLFQKGTVTVTKTNNTTMHVTFVRENQWAQLCYGSYRYKYAPGTTSFTNQLHTVTVYAAKAWQDFSGTAMTPAAGTTATFDLYINGIAQNRQIVLNGKTDVASEEDLSEDETERAKQEVNAEAIAANAYESEPWKAFWCDLAEYDAAGKPIVYTVKEVSASEGFANQNTEGVSSGETITNKQTEMTINVLKVDGRDGTTPLAGAKFKLRRYTNDKYQECEKEWPEQEVSSEPATKGTLTFTNISVGYYELEESEPPEGYVKTGSNPRFTVTEDEDGNLQVTFTNTDMVTYENGEFKVENEPGAALPSTGGCGTWPFTIVGSILILGAGVLLWRRRRTI